MKWIYHIIYHPVINFLLRQLFFVFKKIIPLRYLLPISGTFSLHITSQKQIYLSVNQTSYIAKTLYYHGFSNYEYSSIFWKLASKMDCFFDVGANIGYYSLLAASAQPKMTIHAFEPSPGAMHYFQKNIQLNHYQALIHPHSVALGSETGKATFYTIKNPKFPSIPNLSGEHNLGTKKNLKHNPHVVETMQLDDFVKLHDIQKIDIIKLDTEGNEHHILKSAHQSIQKFQPILICEVLYQTIESDLQSIVEQHNYHIFSVKGSQLHPLKTLIRKEDDGVRNCFFVPQCKLHLINEFKGYKI